MRLKKSESAEQGRTSRRSMVQGQGNPAFSYYRRPEAASAEVVRNREQRFETNNEAATKKPNHRWQLTNLPAWLLLVVVTVCVVKVLTLGTEPKVIILGKTDITDIYGHNANEYATAMHSILSHSMANRTKLTADLSGSSSQLERQFPELQDASMTVPIIGNRPIVYVQLAEPALIVQSPKGTYALNSDGVVLAKLLNTLPNVPVVADESGTTPSLGKQLLPGTTASFIRSIAYQLKSAKLTVSVFVLPRSSPYEMDVRLEGAKYVIRMNLVESPLEQSGAIVATIQHLSNNLPSQYIDVRVSGRAYFK